MNYRDFDIQCVPRINLIRGSKSQLDAHTGVRELRKHVSLEKGVLLVIALNK